MMNQAQTSAHTYADLIRESLVSMMVNSQEVDTTYLLRVNRIQQFDSLAVLVNSLHLREELLSPEQIERIAAKKRQSAEGDSIRARVIRQGEPAFLRTGQQFRAVIPFNATKVCQKCHAVPVNYTLGAADLRFSLARFSDAAADNWRRSILIFCLFTLVAIGVAAVVFKRTVTKPVERLVDATKQIQKGNLRAPIPHNGEQGRRGGDELEFLAERFNEMRESLADKIAQLDQANNDLSRRNAELESAMQQLRKAQEELVRSERLAVTGKMAAQLSHEINNPIHNTQSLLESSLKRIGENDQTRELIGLALEEVTRMATLTRQLLEIHRGSVVETTMEPIDIATLLRDVTRSHRENLARYRIEVVLESAEALPMICGERDKLKQVFLNLFLNARDAMPEGGTIRVTAEASQGWVLVKVADTGIGIRPDDLNKIFDAFFTTKKEVSGVGLGLSVTYGIIKQHQGEIEVASTVGKGTTFTIRFPQAKTDDDSRRKA